MPWTEDDLRTLLRDRTAPAPPTPDLADRVRDRVRRRRRQEIAAGAAALVVALVVAVIVAVPRPDVPAPVTPSPSPSPGSTWRTEQQLGDLDVTTEGPLTIRGTTPFSLRITVHNTGSRAWTGMVAIGLVHGAAFPGWFDGGLITNAGDPATTADFGSALPEMRLEGGRQVSESYDALLVQGDQVVAAGASRTWTLLAARDPRFAVTGDVVGWVPFVNPSHRVGSEQFGDVDAAARLTVTPAASTLPCADVRITSTSVGPATGWQFSEVATATVGADRVARWRDVSGLDPQSTNIVSSAGQDARDPTIAAAIAATGVGRPSAFGPPAASRPGRLDPGAYVTYAAYTLVPVSFTGTCAPSGASISGTWTSYDGIDVGLVTCATNPPAGTVSGEVKRRFCGR